MGLMLVQCGLGAWHLALLHLLAHSLYKAHTVLNAGGRVDQWRLTALAGAPAVFSPARLLGSAAIVVLVAVAVAMGDADAPPPDRLARAVLVLAVGWSFVPMVMMRGRALASVLPRLLLVALSYVLWHRVAGAVLPVPSAHPAVALGWLVAGAGFGLLFALQLVVQLRPHGPLTRRLQHWLFAGLHLDERFTRLTFRLWPPPTPTATDRVAPIVAPAPEHAR